MSAHRDRSPRLLFVFLPQVSPDAETCVRCEQLGRASEIAPGEPHFAMIEDYTQQDTAARVVLCEFCDFFIRDALATEGHDTGGELPS